MLCGLSHCALAHYRCQDIPNALRPLASLPLLDSEELILSRGSQSCAQFIANLHEQHVVVDVQSFTGWEGALRQLQ